ncbi:hypothetical protein [Halobacillus kuroshimensis]|nr:hypothetical protein [Halobacillus kuroshimensis]
MQVRRFKSTAWAALMTAACRNMKKVVLHPARVIRVKKSLFRF